MVSKKKIPNWKKENLGPLSKLKHTFEGLLYSFNDVWTKRHYLSISILNILSLLFVPGIMEKGILITMGLVVLGIEYINSSIETTVDRIGLKYHILSKHAKDLAAGGSFLVIMGLFVLIAFTGIYVIQYYKEWKKDKNEKKNIFHYIKDTWTLKRFKF